MNEVPYLRIVRDKRGYEYFSLIEPTASRRGKVRHRLLYWFRTPPGLKIGRDPFDDDVKRTLEAQYPDVPFDWQALRNTPLPPPSAEPWRERRRAERAARQWREREDTGDVPAEDGPPPALTEPGPPSAAEADPSAITSLTVVETVVVEMAVTVSETVEIQIEPAAGQAESPGRGRRRRRGRRGRGDRPAAGPTQAEQGPPASTDAELDQASFAAEDEEDDPSEL